jgi:acyl phosphate:glycerol-3-phosphate acyltransferase
MAEAFAIVVGYILGSMPWGFWLPRLFLGLDIRTAGSGNPGATNVWRVLGFRWGLTVALLDVAKGLAAALLGVWIGGDLFGVLAGVAAMVGHWRPMFLGWGKGGKMVATTGGVGLGVATFASLAGVGVWIAVFLVTRYASVASMVSAATLPLFAILFGASWPVVAFTVGAALGIVLLHKSNIARLFRGTENRFELRRRRAPQRA